MKCYSEGCLGGDKKVDLFGLIGVMEHLPAFTDQRRRALEIFRLNGSAPKRRIMATYDYTDEHGILLYQAVRFEPKDFSQRRPDGHGGWIWDLKNTRLVLYRLPDVIHAHTVLVLEGEKDVDSAYSVGLPEGWAATCNPMGAGKGKWRHEYCESLRGKSVVLLGDEDEPGRHHVGRIARSIEEYS